MAQADGSIIIDTEINADGMEAGSAEVEAAVRRMTSEVEEMGEKAKIALKKQEDAFVAANKRYSQQKKKVEEIKEELVDLENVEIETEEFKALGKELNNVQKDLTKSTDALEVLEEKKEKLNNTELTSKDIEKYHEKLNETIKKAQELETEMERVFNDNYSDMLSVDGSKERVESLQAIDREYQQNRSELEKLGELVEKYEGKLDDAREAREQLHIAAQNDLDAEINEATEAMENYTTKLDEAATKQQQMKDDGRAFIDPTSTEKYTKTVTKLITEEQRLEDMNNRLGTSYQAIKNKVESCGKAVSGAASAKNKQSKASEKATKSINKQSKATDRLNKSSGKAKMGIGKLIAMSLGFGTIMKVFNAMRRALVDGFTNLAKYSGETNTSLSNLKGSLSTLKNSLATAFAPILNAIAPILTKFINMLATAATYVSMFFAALTGRNTYTKAIAQQEDFTASTEDATGALNDAADAAKKYLSPIDEINKMDDKSSSSSGSGGGAGDVGDAMFEEVALEGRFGDLAAKVKEIFGKIFQPFKEAWSNQGEATINAIKYALGEIWELIKSIGVSFLDVWTNGTGTVFLSNILLLLQIVLGVIGDITKAFKDAWNDNGLGTSLIQSIFDMLNNILTLLQDIGKAFREAWNDNGLGQKIATNILEIFKGIFDIVGELAGRLQEAWNKNDTGKKIFESILKIINDVLTSLKNIVTATTDWAKSIDFSPILMSIDGLLQAIEPLTKNIFEGLEWFYINVLLPLASYVIGEVIPVFLDLLSSAIGVVNEVIEALKPLALWLFDSFLKPIASWTGGVIVDVLGAIGEALSAIGDWASNNHAVIQRITEAVAGFFIAWKITQLAAFIQMSGGVVAALAKIATALFGATAAKIADKAETIYLTALYAKDFIVSLVNGAIALAKQAAAFIASTAAKVADTVAQIAMTAATVAWNVVATIATTVTTALGAAIAFLTSPIGIVIVIIGALIAIGVLLYKNWEDICKWCSEIWGAIKDAFKETIDQIVRFFVGLWEGLVDIFQGVGSWFKEKFEAAKESVINAFIKIGSWFSDRWEDIKKVFSGIGSWFSGIFTGAYTNVKNAFSAIGSWFAARWSDIVNVFNNIGSWFSNKFTAALTGIKNAFSGIGSFFSGVWNGITNVFSNVANWFKNIFSNAWEGVKRVFSSGGQVFAGIQEGILNALKSVINGLISGINTVISIPFSGINSALSGIRSISIMGARPFSWLPTISTPKIPFLAKGAVIPPNAPFMAMLGDQKNGTNIEAPLDTIKQALREVQGESGGGSYTFTAQMSRRTLFEECITEAKLRQTTTGRNPFELA